jgi:hypothetical protein
MDFSVPQTLIMDTQMIVAVIGFFIVSSAALAYGYARLIAMIKAGFTDSKSSVAALKEELDQMKVRNEKADEKTERLDAAQKAQETTIAVMARDTGHVREGMVRLEKAITDLGQYIMESHK